MKLQFFRLKEDESLPGWHSQLGSFKKEVILKHAYEIPNIADLIIEESVNTLSFENLVRKYSIGHISLLHIDTEGYDFEIIKSIDFDNCIIGNILFENLHLSETDYAECIKYLESNGFLKINRFGGDTFCSAERL